MLQERADDGNDLLEVLSERIVEQLSSSRAIINNIAADLGTGERTLSRRLAQQGINFDRLIDDIRRDLAMRYLDQSRSSCRSWPSCWISLGIQVSHPLSSDEPARRKARRGACIEDRLQVARRSNVPETLEGKPPDRQK